MDNILLASNDNCWLRQVKQFFSKSFDMKDMNEASNVIDINIHRGKFRGSLGLS